MPTQHPRTHITHTPLVVHALEVARRRWPDEVRESTLILNLLDEGAKALEQSIIDKSAQHSARVREIAGKYSGLYDQAYLDELREGWPE